MSNRKWRETPVWRVSFLDDRDPPHVMVRTLSRKQFAREADAVRYAASISESRDPLVIEEPGYPYDYKGG